MDQDSESELRHFSWFFLDTK